MSGNSIIFVILILAFFYYPFFLQCKIFQFLCMMRDFVMKPGHFYIMRHRNLFKTFFTASFLWYHSHRGKGGGVLPYYYQVEIEVQVPQWPQLTPKRKRVLLLLIARQEWEFWLIKWCPLTSWWSCHHWMMFQVPSLQPPPLTIAQQRGGVRWWNLGFPCGLYWWWWGRGEEVREVLESQLSAWPSLHHTIEVV